MVAELVQLHSYPVPGIAAITPVIEMTAFAMSRVQVAPAQQALRKEMTGWMH
jgi:hypothetical protein